MHLANPRTLVRAAVIVAALSAAAAGCGQDEGATVRELDGSSSASGSGTASGSATASGTAGSGSLADVACEPVGDASAAEGTLDTQLSEWAITPSATEVPSGSTNIVADNIGEEPHEVVVVKGSDPAALPTREDGSFDEEAYGEDNIVGEIEAFPSGEVCNGVFDLPQGDVILLCNITEVEDDGTVESHFAEGMATTITVG